MKKLIMLVVCIGAWMWIEPGGESPQLNLPQAAPPSELLLELPQVQDVSVVVDYSQTFSAMIEAGKYTEVGDEITEKNFPKTKKGKEKISLRMLQVANAAPVGVLRRELEKLGFRSVTLYEVMAFRSANISWKNHNPVILFDTVKRKDFEIFPFLFVPPHEAMLVSDEGTDEDIVDRGTLVFAVAL
jgi:hypothetical protein